MKSIEMEWRFLQIGQLGGFVLFCACHIVVASGWFFFFFSSFLPFFVPPLPSKFCVLFANFSGLTPI